MNITKEKFDIPILFLIFNRLDTTKQVFFKIRDIAPSKIYIASDGSRSNRVGEEKIVSEVRNFVLQHIDWNCEVKTLFRERNLGCGKAVSQAITWFFENEEMGIILEDDCLPSNSFFAYCKELLKYYKDNKQIFHISGFNPLTITKSPYSYYFSKIQHCWGWATWRRAWRQYNFDIKDNIDFIQNNVLKTTFSNKSSLKYWLHIFDKMKRYEIDTWDYQWTYVILKNNGICINPSKNLIRNIGFDASATHTKNSNSRFSNQKIYKIEDIKHCNKIGISKTIVNKINKIAFGIESNILKIVLKKIKKIITIRLKKYYKKLKYIFGIKFKCNYIWHGNEYGGFYLCEDILSSKFGGINIIYSAGIGEDISFDSSINIKFSSIFYLFDPTPKSIDWIHDQKLPDNFLFFPYGISSISEEKELFLSNTELDISASIYVHEYTSKENAIKVQMKCLKDITKNNNHSFIDILKLDVEGCEFDIINNFPSDIIFGQILIEFHERFIKNGKKMKNWAINKLKKLGYLCFAISNSGNEYSFVNRKFYYNITNKNENIIT